MLLSTTILRDGCECLSNTIATRSPFLRLCLAFVDDWGKSKDLRSDKWFRPCDRRGIFARRNWSNHCTWPIRVHWRNRLWIHCRRRCACRWWHCVRRLRKAFLERFLAIVLGESSMRRFRRCSPIFEGFDRRNQGGSGLDCRQLLASCWQVHARLELRRSFLRLSEAELIYHCQCCLRRRRFWSRQRW